MQAQKYSIKDWAKDDRPREKLLSIGAGNMSDSELIAIILHKGTRDKNAIELAREVLKVGKDNLRELGKLSVEDLKRIRGIGEAKAITLLAALELGRRRQSANLLDKSKMLSSLHMANWLQNRLQDFQREVFAVIFLNRGNKVNHFEIISEGGITGTVADPRIILKMALQHNAVSMILAHNHPSGNLKPSKTDLDLTKKLIGAARYFDIKILDHIIVGETGYFSFADRGLI